MDTIDTVVIGAGVVGLAVARALALRGREVTVLEREAAIGTGTSSRNSEVIHAGIYYPAASLKARLCVQGKAQLYAYCAERGVAHRRCGKLIVATTPSQAAALPAIVAQARAHGVNDLALLTAAEAQSLEPALACLGAVWSPSTGIIDSHGLMLSLQGELAHAGGMVVCHSAVQRLRVTAAGIEVHCSAGQGGNGQGSKQQGGAKQGYAGQSYAGQGGDAAAGEGTVLLARAVVNAAGLDACALAARTEGLAPRHVPRPFFAKGQYFTLAGRSPFQRLIYPAPEPDRHLAGLGVHLTIDLGGQAKFGPDVTWTERPDDLLVDPVRAADFYTEVRRYWPGLPDGALLPGYAGMRPKISGPGEPAADFRIDGPGVHGVPGLVNLFGIESPGLTSALALGDAVANLLGSG